MTVRKNLQGKYVPITVEAQQANGAWWVRNTLKDENDLARGGKISRLDLIAAAYRKITLWNNYVIQKPLRVGGIKHKLVEATKLDWFEENVF